MPLPKQQCPCRALHVHVFNKILALLYMYMYQSMMLHVHRTPTFTDSIQEISVRTLDAQRTSWWRCRAMSWGTGAARRDTDDRVPPTMTSSMMMRQWRHRPWSWTPHRWSCTTSQFPAHNREFQLSWARRDNPLPKTDGICICTHTCSLCSSGLFDMITILAPHLTLAFEIYPRKNPESGNATMTTQYHIDSRLSTIRWR